MTVAFYIIGSDITIVVLAVRLHETRHQLQQVTLSLRQVRRERNTCVQAIESWLGLPTDTAPTGHEHGHELAGQPKLWPQQDGACGPPANGADRRPGA